jgi:hypothetical protein
VSFAHAEANASDTGESLRLSLKQTEGLPLTWGRHTRRHRSRTSPGLGHALQSSVVKTGHKSNSDCADAKLQG